MPSETNPGRFTVNPNGSINGTAAKRWFVNVSLSLSGAASTSPDAPGAVAEGVDRPPLGRSPP